MNSLEKLLVLYPSLIGTILCISIALSDYKSLIVDRCFNATNDREPLILGQHNTVGMSIEHLISLIEKLEIKRPQLIAKQIVVLTLKSFHIDGLKYGDNGLTEPSVTEILHRKVTDQIIHSTSLPSLSDFAEEALTEHEKCVLFYTISHTVNDTATHDEQSSNTWHRSPNMGSSNASTQSTQILTIYPREEGVASFRNNIDEAIAVNRVLLGTAVGLLNPESRTLKYIIKSLVTDFIDDNNVYDEQLDPLLAVTLSDLPAYGLTINTLEYGVSGKWNSNACQTSYRLDSNETLVTLAEIRGGIDGYNIGSKVFDIVSRNNNLSLSQVLRMYYSNRGLTPNTGYCKRNPGVNIALLRKFENEAKNYLRIWNWVKNGGMSTDSELNEYFTANKEDYIPFLELAATPVDDNIQFCEPSPSKSIGQSRCESQADVFFMLDNMSGSHPNANIEQIEVITQVVRTLDLRRIGGGSVTVLVNSECESSNNNSNCSELYALSYNTTSSQCVSCSSASFYNSLWPIADRTRLLELINQTLKRYAAKRETYSGVPSKNFVWFEFGNLKLPATDQTGKRKYEVIKRRLKYEHRDVRFFFASIINESMIDLVRRDRDWISLGKGIDNARKQGQELAKKICKTPAIFQYVECRQRKSDNDVYTGFITPGSKQYWAMYAEYFINSYSIEFSFRAENARLKLCYDRYPEPELQKRNCKAPDDDNSEVKFSVNNPCHRKTLENCEPFYFTVSLDRQSRASQQCTDRRCKSLDQVKWTFRYTGISCSSSTFLNACAVLVLTMVFNNIYGYGIS